MAFMCSALSRFSNSFPGSYTVPKLSHIPVFEMPSRKLEYTPETKVDSKRTSVFMEAIRITKEVREHAEHYAMISNKKSSYPIKITSYHSKAPQISVSRIESFFVLWWKVVN